MSRIEFFVPFYLILQLLGIAMSHELGERKDFSLINPATIIKVEQEWPAVRFHFSFSDDFGAEIKKNAANNSITQVVVLDGIGEEIWRIDAATGTHGASIITYGMVPTGFIQIIPKSGNPPKLQVGENYYVRATWPGGAASFVYQ